MTEVEYALSLKQPWATLLVRGLKTVEVRAWPTQRRGRILIHAARVPDSKAWGWDQLPKELHREAEVGGGIIGVGRLTACVTYPDKESFTADQARHLNDPAWFRPPVLYGFTFEQLSPLPFRRYPGWVKFFPVGAELPRRKRSKGSAEDRQRGPHLF
jgi:hypothetical protein